MNQEYIQSIIDSQEFQTLLNTPVIPKNKNTGEYGTLGKFTSTKKQIEDGTLQIDYTEYTCGHGSSKLKESSVRYTIHSNGYVRIGRNNTWDGQMTMAPRRIPEDVSNFMTIYPTGIQLLTNISLKIKSVKDTGILNIDSLCQYLNEIYDINDIGCKHEMISGLLGNGKVPGKHIWILNLVKKYDI
jgi:hypothetical protein